MRTQNEYLEVKFRNTRVFMTYINLSSDLESNQDLGFNDTISQKMGVELPEYDSGTQPCKS